MYKALDNFKVKFKGEIKEVHKGSIVIISKNTADILIQQKKLERIIEHQEEEQEEPRICKCGRIATDYTFGDSGVNDWLFYCISCSPYKYLRKNSGGLY